MGTLANGQRANFQNEGHLWTVNNGNTPGQSTTGKEMEGAEEEDMRV